MQPRLLSKFNQKSLFFTVIIKFLTIGSFQEMLRQEAVEAIAKLKIRKFRRRVKDSSHYAIKQVEQERRDSEVCAVCLDEFQNNQVRIDETEWPKLVQDVPSVKRYFLFFPS